MSSIVIVSYVKTSVGVKYSSVSQCVVECSYVTARFESMTRLKFGQTDLTEAAEIVGVSEPEFDTILSEKFPPNGKRGTSGIYYSCSLW